MTARRSFLKALIGIPFAAPAIERIIANGAPPKAPLPTPAPKPTWEWDDSRAVASGFVCVTGYSFPLMCSGTFPLSRPFSE